MKFIAPSWDEIYLKCISLAEILRKKESVPLDYIVGVSRGGLILARILSDLLDIQNVGIIKCEYYSDIGETNRRPRISQKLQDDVSGKNVLLIDDVADTGESLAEIRSYMTSRRPRSFKIATIYVKPKTRIVPDYYVGNTSSWVIFPWELYETLKLLSRRKVKFSVAKTHIPNKYARILFKMDPKLIGYRTAQ